MRYTHYDELKKRWQINDDYGAVMIDEVNYAVGEAIDKLAAYEDAEEDKGYILAPQEEYDGLKRKYVVLKSDSGEPVEDCFVLRPDKDKAAIAALLAYADATENQVLAKDIRAWISAIPAEEATQKDGGQVKPCPFCGNEYISVVPSIDKRSYWCKCEECEVSTRCFNEKQEAIDFWNRRATDV